MSLLLDSIEFVANYATLWTGNQGGLRCLVLKELSAIGESLKRYLR